MQGLPFDDSDFPTPSVGLTSSWMEQSPRIIPTNASTAPATVGDDELYPVVAVQQQSAASPPPPPKAEDIQRLSQHLPVIASSPLPLYSHPQGQPHLHQQQTLHSQLSQPQPHQIQHHQPPNITPPPQGPSRGRRPRLTHPAAIPDVSIKSSSAAAFLHQSKRMPPQISTIPPERQSATSSQAVVHHSGPEQVARIQANPVGLETYAHSATAPRVHRGSPIIASSGMLVPEPAASNKGPGFFPPDRQKKPARSAVEEARLRAQQEAESFANSRRDPMKRETGLTLSGNQSDGFGIDITGDRRSSKRAKPNPEGSAAEGSSSRKGSRGPSDEKMRTEEDSEAEKQERYKRRLDMNRESAAVSRVRRRAYVKELEERLAAVEAEKLQLEGKLEIMQSQNEGFKKQLDNLFMMVTSGRRPQYPPPPQQDPP
eukprot:GFKZ01005644.1.p1 GENE.GFKZ01005644.1~~GFKZ01005644.1.p1  ORF type:complete len:428 (+),score=61.48 GFKZ01005644.1:589-1872(+)